MPISKKKIVKKTKYTFIVTIKYSINVFKTTIIKRHNKTISPPTK